MLRARIDREIKGCPFFYFAASPNLPTVPPNDTLHSSQPDATSRKFRCRMEALKGLKQPIRRPLIKAAAIISNEIHRLFVLPCHSKLNTGAIVV